MAECGFTAGILLILSFFYPKGKLTTRVGFFYLSSPLSNVFSGPLASALSHIDHPTIKHWQWVFILEGLITVVVAFFGYYIFQDHPEKCSFLSDDEKEFIVAYKRREGTLGGSEQLSMRDTKRTLFDWQLWCMTVANFAVCAGCVTVSVFAPEVINELGFSATEAQAMSALPSACGAIAILLAGQIVKLCRSHWLAGSLSIGVALVGSIIMVATLSVPMRVFGLCLVGTGSFAGLGILPGWIITANSQTVANSAVASGLTVFMGASASFVTSNVFLNWDAPSKTDGTFQTSTESQTKANLPPEEWETDHVRDKRRQWLLKCLGDNIGDSYLFDDFVKSLGVKQRYKRFIKDWPDLFLDIARGSPVADSKGIVANARYAINEFDDFPIADVFKKYSGKLMGLTKEARLVEYFILLFNAMVNAVDVANRVIPAGGTPIPECGLIAMVHKRDVIQGTPHKPAIAFYHRYTTRDIHSVHAILEAKVDPAFSGPPEDTRGQLADYGH
ncbi:hypothetical protein GGF37_003811, partial [Kickxella alabastrina]